jgi:hypothetical protein
LPDPLHVSAIIVDEPITFLGKALYDKKYVGIPNEEVSYAQR